MRLAPAVAAWLVVLLLPGCIDVVPAEGPIFVLEYTLRYLGDGAEAAASPGEHCGTARVHESHVEIGDRTWDGIGRPDVFVIVDPELDGPWATLGDEPFPLALPAEVRPHVDGDDEVIATLEWRSDNAGNEGLWVDGRAVTLPLSFTHNSRSGDWDAVAFLSEGPNEVRTFEQGMCM